MTGLESFSRGTPYPQALCVYVTVTVYFSVRVHFGHVPSSQSNRDLLFTDARNPVLLVLLLPRNHPNEHLKLSILKL